MLAEDVELMNKQLAKGKLVTAAQEAEKKIQHVKTTLMEFEGKLKSAVGEVERLKTHMEAGSHFIHAYEDLLNSLPNSIVG